MGRLLNWNCFLRKERDEIQGWWCGCYTAVDCRHGDNVTTWRARGSTVIILNTKGRRQWLYFVVCDLRILDPVDWHDKCLYEERSFRCCLNDSRLV
jgi:hypothetical protein